MFLLLIVCALTGLETLNLRSSRASIYQATGTLADFREYLPNIKALSFRECLGITGDLSKLAGLSAITTLKFCPGCEHFTGDLSSLAALDSLTNIHLSSQNLLVIFHRWGL